MCHFGDDERIKPVSMVPARLNPNQPASKAPKKIYSVHAPWLDLDKHIRL